MTPAETPKYRRTTERAAMAVVLLATLWYALAACWCLFTTVGAGHDALVASRGMMAENMWKWGILGPVRNYVLEQPKPDAYYTHHPFGTYWLVAIFAKIFGRHAFVPRLGPVLQSIAMPPLLYGIGRRLWGPVPGALGALAYTVVPIALAFANLAGFEVPTAFACVLTAWGYVRFTERWQKRWMLVSLLGVAWGVNVDWNYVLFLGAMLGLLTLGAVYLPPRLYGRIHLRAYTQWALLAAAIATACVVAWVWYFHQIGALEALLQSDAKRSKGADAALDGILRARRYWIDVSFTPLAILLGKIAFPILVFRVLFMGRTREVVVLAIWLMAFVTYVKFKNGADVHIYWPFAFAAYFALAFGVLSQCAISVVRWILARRKRLDEAGLVPLVALGGLSLVPLAMLPDALDGLHYGRQTGGRFNEKGSRAFRDVDKAVALEWMGAQMAPDAIVDIHDGMRSTWALDWAVHHPLKGVKEVPNAQTPPEERYFIADLDFLPAADQRKLADSYRTKVVDHFVVADRAVPQAAVEAYVFDERQPTFLEWYLAYGTEPVRTIRPDAWATWELRNAWGQTPNAPPTGEPQTLEQVRIAHNVAVFTGDGAKAKRYEQRLIAQLDASVAMAYSDGTRFIGQNYQKGVLPTLALFFQCAASTNDDFEFAIASVVEKKKFWSLVSADDKTKQLGAPFPVPTRFWRPGFIYSEHAPIHHRPGLEHFTGRFEPLAKEGHAPTPMSESKEIPLLDIE